MTREQALAWVSEWSCAYKHVRMTDCPHCAKNVEDLVKTLMEPPPPSESGKGEA